MGRAFYDAWPATRSRFDALDEAADVDLSRLCFGADEETLRATANTQPAVYATGVAAHAGALERLDAPDFVAGHSLGHLTAATAAGALDPREGIELVRRRGELMQRAAERDGPGTMVAVLLADPNAVVDACDGVEGAGVAAFNAPRQTVVSGTEAAVERVTSAVEDETRVRITALDVGAAFHSPVMRSAADPFAAALDRTDFDRASIPVCSDVSTAVYTAPAVARRDLAAQLTAPIDWVGVVEALAARGVDRFVEFPPAGTLASLVEKVAPDAETIALDSPTSLP
jgi:[acyl-carrier-protein] S-malonyltransferase